MENRIVELFLLTSHEIYAWVILPFLIFFARVCDVSLGTIRIIFISKGVKYLAPIVGFFEILIWLLAIGQIMQNITNIYYYLFFAGGFATGTFVGLYLEEKLSIGLVMIRIITKKDSTALINYLKSEKYGVTTVKAEGVGASVKIIFTVIRREDLNKVATCILKFNPNAFYSVEDVRSVSEAMFPQKRPRRFNFYKRLFQFDRKGK